MGQHSRASLGERRSGLHDMAVSIYKIACPVKKGSYGLMKGRRVDTRQVSS